MMEIERKILDIEVKKFTAQLKKLKPAPRALFSGLVRIWYFDFPDGRIRKKKDLLRLREFIPKRGSASVELVYKIYKGVKKGCKYFEELELKMPAKNASFTVRVYESFLLQLGFVQTLYYEKKRTLFSYKKLKFEIDEHPGLPPFLEIEAPSAGAIDKAVKLLKLEKHEQTAESIGELMKRKYPRVSLNGLRFKSRKAASL